MKTQQTYYMDILDILENLHKVYPKYNMGRHIATALSEYPDPWDISDKELLYALNKYQAELEMNHVPDQNIDKIIDEGMHISDLFDEDEPYVD